jgi:hypothetical protein
MAERWLEKYRDEIIEMHRQRLTQARIRRVLEDKYSIDVPKTTISNYLKELRASGLLSSPDEPPVTPEEEHFLEQADVYLKLQQSSVHVVEAIAQLLARMGILEDAARERHEAMQETLQKLEDAMRQGMQTSGRAVEDTRRAIQEIARATPPSAIDEDSLTLPLEVFAGELKKQTQALESLRQQLGTRHTTAMPASWLRALLITGAFWAVLLIVGGALYFAPWRSL